MRVLLATDGSPHSRRALEKAVELARATRAEVQVLVVSSRVFMRPLYGVERDLLVPSQAESGQILQEAYAYMRQHGVVPETLHRVGAPADTILSVARQEGSDLIVLGSHGRSGLQRYLLGSVSEKVLAHAPCSILIVRETAHARIAFPDCALVHRN